MREVDERPWGRFEVLEDQSGYKVKRLEVKPGARLSLQRHSRRGEHWVVVAGIADVVCGDREMQLAHGEHLYIPPETNHRLGNSSDIPLALIEVQLGDYLGEDDIVRLEDDYKRLALSGTDERKAGTNSKDDTRRARRTGDTTEHR
jgi:mannose-6-phosphate isomerase